MNLNINIFSDEPLIGALMLFFLGSVFIKLLTSSPHTVQDPTVKQ